MKVTATRNNDKKQLQIELSAEQQVFLNEALAGSNILVDACIGSGKTTAIQYLCNAYPSDKKILYLTYNKLLKLDAKSKIKNSNVTVTNYHGYAFQCLIKVNIRAGMSDLIQTFINYRPPVGKYDVLIIDEYQDIEQELAEMLCIIKDSNPNIQIVAVGDMKQKVYDKTTLNVPAFVDTFIDNRINLEFTQCFRLSKEHAEKLGRIWNKKIVGVNPNCKIEKMDELEIVEFLKDQNPSDVLCLGARYGDLSRVLNILEQEYPEKYNKNTIYASIRDNDSNGTEPHADSGIFTTFDSSKGLEKDICVVFDYTEDYWMTRIRKPQVNYEILRNIFLVAASRGKNRIIFVKSDTALLSEKTLSTYSAANTKFEDMNISEMFDFKYKEDVEACYSLLKIKKLTREDRNVIKVKTNDGLIDLTPCIGIYQEASFFDKYDLSKDIEIQYETDRDLSEKYRKEFWKRSGDIQGQILSVVSAETHLTRYVDQVHAPFINKEVVVSIHDRLNTEFVPDEQVQARCSFDVQYDGGAFSCIGLADVVKNDVVYELKFVQDLKHEHYLQCACYMVGLGLKKGRLWNVRTNEMYEITIKDVNKFMGKVIKAITKGYLEGIA